MISVPMDLQQVEIKPTFLPKTNISKPRADRKDIEQAIHLVMESKRPVILAGGWVNNAKANIQSEINEGMKEVESAPKDKTEPKEKVSLKEEDAIEEDKA